MKGYYKDDEGGNHAKKKVIVNLTTLLPDVKATHKNENLEKTRKKMWNKLSHTERRKLWEKIKK